MPRKNKPDTYIPSDSFPFKSINNAVFNKMEKIIKKEIGPAIRKRMQRLTLRYILSDKGQSKRPGINSIKTTLKNLTENTKTLLDILKNLGSETQVHIYIANIGLTGGKNKKTYSDKENEELEKLVKEKKYIKTPRFYIKNIDATYERCKNDLQFIHDTAQRAFNTMKDSKGQPGPVKKRSSLRDYIAGLETIYQEQTGKRGTISRDNNARIGSTGQFKGDFIDFVELCLSITGEQIPRSTLGAQIEIVLKQIKKMNPG